MDFSVARLNMVESQIRTGDVTEPKLVKALRNMPRELFVPVAKKSLAYADMHIACQDGRYTLRPRDMAKMIQALEIKSKDFVLDVACGRGYATAILARLADTVVGLDVLEDLVEKASTNLTEVNVNNAAIVQGDLLKGALEHGPFDVVYVNGAVADVPQAWINLLSDGGRLGVFMPVDGVVRATIFTKKGGAVSSRIIFDAHVPYLPEFTPQSTFAL